MRYLALVTALLLLPLPAIAAEPAKPTVEVKKLEDGGLKGLLDQMWAKLRRYGPDSRNRGEKTVTVVAGIRGAESTASSLNPYWKGDKTNDPAYIEELKAFNQAQGFAEGGDLKQAVTAFDAFLASHPDSSLKPNAQFALGLAYAGMAEKTKGVPVLQGFVKTYPKHPLAEDAGRVLAELQKL